MKQLLVLLLFFSTSLLSAQPGYTVGMRKSEFDYITKTLKDDPLNYPLIWKRLNIVSKTHFAIYTHGGIVRDSLVNSTNEIAFNHFTNVQRLLDINKLIESDTSFGDYGATYTIIDFTLFRGKVYYLMGEYEKALSDYKFALERIPEDSANKNTTNIKDQVCITLASYYYNLHHNKGETYEPSRHEGNFRQALKYIDMVSPVEFTEDFSKAISYIHGQKVSDPYQREKIRLLTFLKEEKRVVKYYKQLMFLQYELFRQSKSYHDIWRNTEVKENGYPYSVNNDRSGLLSYAHDLAGYYYETKHYEKAKTLSELAIAYHVKNTEGFILDRFNVGFHYLLLNKIYQTPEFKDFDLEMNSLLDALGGSFHGNNYNTEELGAYIEKRLKEHPKEPRLYLALTIWHYENRTSSYYGDKTETGEFLRLLNKAEQLNLKDYRFHFTRALVHLNLDKNYKAGLSEINKALTLNTINPFTYQIKSSLLRKIPDSSPKELEKLSIQTKSKLKRNSRKYIGDFLKELSK